MEHRVSPHWWWVWWEEQVGDGWVLVSINSLFSLPFLWLHKPALIGLSATRLRPPHVEWCQTDVDLVALMETKHTKWTLKWKKSMKLSRQRSTKSFSTNVKWCQVCEDSGLVRTGVSVSCLPVWWRHLSDSPSVRCKNLQIYKNPTAVFFFFFLMEVKVESAVPMGTGLEKGEMCEAAQSESQWIEPEVRWFHLQNKNNTASFAFFFASTDSQK